MACIRWVDTAYKDGCMRRGVLVHRMGCSGGSQCGENARLAGELRPMQLSIINVNTEGDQYLRTRPGSKVTWGCAEITPASVPHLVTPETERAERGDMGKGGKLLKSVARFGSAWPALILPHTCCVHPCRRQHTSVPPQRLVEGLYQSQCPKPAS